eukprot:c7125_g1_i1.p1 GENE.c7125_g1_i1~~c7125_g1_i1.p1  ORF type:complete len:343 (-),score=80.25 c7125_g1_i1:44-1072(-)
MEIVFKRSDNVVGWFIELALSFVIWNYGLWLMWISCLCVVLVWGGAVRVGTLVVVVALYVLQMLLWKPQIGKPFKYWKFVLFNSLLDPILSYLGATLIREGPPLDPTKQYMFAWAPHGILGLCRMGSACSSWQKLFPGVTPRWASFGAAYYIPGIREFSLATGTMDASRKVMERQIQKGDSVHLIPGGIQEMMATDGESTQTAIVIKNRFGFVEVAVEGGLSLVPVFCFGEKWTSHKLMFPKFLQSVLHTKYRLSSILPISRFYTFLPYDRYPDGRYINMGWVFGEPIPVQKMASSDPKFREYVHKLHETYVKHLEEIFERHKRRFGYAKEETVVFLEVKKR